MAGSADAGLKGGREQGKEATDGDARLGAGESEQGAGWREICALAVPGTFSVVSIIVQGMGLRYVSASVSLMLSGSCVIFTAVLSVLLLKCRLNALHLSGIGLTVGGIIIVSAANLVWPEVAQSTHHHDGLGGAGSSGSLGVVLGIVLTLLSMLVLAMRLVSEEFALQGTTLHPLQVLGYEGMWGTLEVGILGLPLARLLPGGDVDNCQENTADSFELLFSNLSLNIINLVFFLSVVGLNIFGLMVTSRLGSVFRAVLLTSRTATVWIIDLILFYMHVGGGGIGEPWANPASWFQLFGFTLLLLGTVIYAQGSSAVAQHNEHHKLAGDDPEAVGGDGRLRPLQSAVTRLRPYTSLYIPHGPREILRRDNEHDDVLLRRAASLPQQHTSNSFSRAFSPDMLQTRSYTPGLLHAESSGTSVSSGASDRPGGLLPRTGSSLFLHTLTHHSSWIVPRQRGLPQGRSPSASSRPEDDFLDSPHVNDLDGGDQASTSRSPMAMSDGQNSPTTEFGSAGPSDPAQAQRPRMGRSPSPQSMIEYRRSMRRSVSGARMPAVEETDEALRPSLDEPTRHQAASQEPNPFVEGQKEAEANWHLPSDAQAKTGPRHVFGQSPAAPVLLSRKSIGRSRKSELAPFAEAQDTTSPRTSRPVEAAAEVQVQALAPQSTSITGGPDTATQPAQRKSTLGQSPTPEKLIEQRRAAAKGRGSQPLAALPEAAAAGASSSSSSSSSLDTSDEDAPATQSRRVGSAASTPEPSDDEIADDINSSRREERRRQRRPNSDNDSRLRPKTGGSSASLQWAGEPMSL